MKYMMSKSLYHDRSAWRTLFVNLQELIFLPGDWLEREREREREREGGGGGREKKREREREREKREKEWERYSERVALY